MDGLDDQAAIPENASRNLAFDEFDDTSSLSIIRSVVNSQKLAALAGKAHSQAHSQAQPQAQPQVNPKSPVIGEPVEYTFHVIFPIEFDDNTRWLAKIPANGIENKWDQDSAAALTAEARTMILLSPETTIPVPEVFAYSSTTRNDIGCPYIIMSSISGISLNDVWFGHQINGIDVDIAHSRRVLALNDIASAMAQLGKYTFDNGGSIEFDAEGNPSGVGPTRFLDCVGALNQRFIQGNLSNEPVWAGAASFSDTKKFYTFFLDLHPETNAALKSVTALLKRFIGWIPEPQTAKSFVLAHPDFDLDSFIVSEDGHLQGIVGWHGTIATPRSIGNEKYPRWLIRDWDPAMYGYKSLNGVDKVNRDWENSPEELQNYRRIYEEAMSRAKGELGLPSSDLNITQMSLITENIALCARDPRRRNSILKKLVQEIRLLTNAPVSLEFKDLATSTPDNNDKEAAWEALEDGFGKLLLKAHCY